MDMKRVSFLGHFAFGLDKANGQTIKTKILGDEMKRQIGEDQVDFYDTMGGWLFVLKMPFILFRMLKNYKNVVVHPAYKGVRVIIPCLVLMNVFFHRKLHYIVLGGWLPSFVGKYPLLRWSLRRLDGMYSETHLIQDELKSYGLDKVMYLPNCKQLDIVPENELTTDSHPPFRVCTFSRVNQTKGITEAVEAVNRINREAGKTVYTLDIYGLVEDEKWFKNLMDGQPDTIHYGGIIPYDQSASVLRQYFCLLFPSYHAGEGFAATMIDAYAAGLPPIATRWRSNPEVVTDGETGFLIKPFSVDELVEKMRLVADNPSLIDRMRVACVRRASLFQPANAIKPLIENLV